MKSLDWLTWVTIITLPLNIVFSFGLGNYSEVVAWTVALIWFLGYQSKKES